MEKLFTPIFQNHITSNGVWYQHSGYSFHFENYGYIGPPYTRL